jgi:hypothetical protein
LGIFLFGAKCASAQERSAAHPPKELLKFPNWRFAETAKYAFSGFDGKSGFVSDLFIFVKILLSSNGEIPHT